MKDLMRFHKKNIIIDGLNASWFLDDNVLINLHRGGVTAVNATIAAWHSPVETIDMVGQMYQKLDEHADIAQQVRTVSDIKTAKSSNRVGYIFGFQGSAPIADQINLLRVYHELGIRIMQLTYNLEDRVGCGCQAPKDKGLTDFGRLVISEMNRLGMLIDLSHCGPKTTLEAIEVSEQPVAITHSNPASQFFHPRNKSDEIIQAMAEKSGVIGAVSFPALLTHNLPANIDDYINVIDQLVKMVGINSVALGPDFMEYMPKKIEEAALQDLLPETQELFRNMPPVERFSSITDMSNVTQSLLERGYSKADTRKIMGENWLRLYQQVWDV